jgi:hypothetical protein
MAESGFLSQVKKCEDVLNLLISEYDMPRRPSFFSVTQFLYKKSFEIIRALVSDYGAKVFKELQNLMLVQVLLRLADSCVDNFGVSNCHFVLFKLLARLRKSRSIRISKFIKRIVSLERKTKHVNDAIHSVIFPLDS